MGHDESEKRRASLVESEAAAKAAARSLVKSLKLPGMGAADGDVEAAPEAEQSAEDVLRALAPACSPAVLARLRKEHIRTAADLAALSREDLRDLGLTMAERCRVLRWSQASADGEGLEKVGTNEEGSGTPGRGTATRPYHRRGSLQAPLMAAALQDDGDRSDAGEDSDADRHFLTKVEQQAEFWCRLVSDSSAALSVQQLRQAESGDGSRRGRSLHSHFVRENVLEAQFDLTPERVQELYRRTRELAGGAVCSAEQLSDGLRRCGLTGVDDSALAKAMEVVTQGRCTGTETWQGLKLAEFEVILSRLKLGQLLSDMCLVAGSDSSSSQLMYMDYDPHDFRTPHVLEGSELADFYFGHRTKIKPTSEVVPLRWIHLSGRHLTLLLSLTVKYRLHPLLVEGILEQCQTKVDRYGAHYFVAIDQLCLVGQYLDSDAALRPVQVSGRHIAVICTAPPALDTVVTVVQPDLSFANDWPGAASSMLARQVSIIEDAPEVDHWVSILQQRIQAVRSRVRERRADFLVYQIVDLCADDLIAITRAYALRLAHLEEFLKPPRSSSGPPPQSWLREISQVRLQLAVVARRLRGLRRTVRRIQDDTGLSAGLSTYLEDIGDHLEEAHEDAMQLAERCVAFLAAYEHAVERQQEHVRRRLQEQERARADEQSHHAERLNNTLFVLTVATTIFAPVQFLAGVYGMNFTSMDGHPTIPELLWPHGYLFFWCLVVAYLAISICFAAWLFRRLKLRSDSQNEQRESNGSPSSTVQELQDPGRMWESLLVRDRARELSQNGDARVPLVSDHGLP